MSTYYLLEGRKVKSITLNASEYGELIGKGIALFNTAKEARRARR